MTAVALMSRPSTSSSTRPLPSLPTAGPLPPSPTITLPRLHIPSDATPSPFLTFAPSRTAPLVPTVELKPLGAQSHCESRSPLSPASLAEKPQSPEPKCFHFGLAHLVEAVEQCHPLSAATAHSRCVSAGHSPQAQDDMSAPKSRLHSIDYLINRPADEERPLKRARPDLQLNVEVPYPFPPRLSFHHQTAPCETTTTPVYHGDASSYMNITPVGTHVNASARPEDSVDTKNVWETVLLTGNFPEDICLSENPSCCTKSNESSGNPVKQGRWTNDEKEFAESLIQQVRNGEVSLPPNTSLRKFIADSLQCKAMRVSKKFRSLRACQSPDGSSSGDDRKFNPLSLHSIMNDDADDDSFDDEAETQESPKQSSKTLKRSDYSQHGAVRSGRWSVEEENYAKAMIEAFKNGFLPLHGNVSLRKFLSEVLVCHPMRISKKFVGYVRKYHWYRIAAGKCDPEAKRRALKQLCQLEREFWTSLQQNQEWATIQQENRR